MLVNQNVRTIVFIVTLTYFDSLCLGYHLLPHTNTSLLRRTRQTNCGSTQFACISGGECLSFKKVCDGHRDCTDGSDESYGCKYVTCPDNAFRCKYGACVDSNSKCNGQKECADGSDEDPAICGSGTTSKPVSKPPPTSVTQPPPTDGACSDLKIDNSQYKILGQNGQDFVPGSPIPNYSIVKLTCNKNYLLYPNNPIVNCIDGNWNIPLPQCKESCLPRISSSVDVTCTVNGKPVDCSQPVEDGTVAVDKCKEYYTQDDNVVPISKCIGGSWDNPVIRCQPECGKVVAEGVTLIINGQNSKRGEFPWHVALYRKNTDKHQYICGGSIITPQIILTAAHCVTDHEGNRYPAEEYYVGAGKYYSDYDADGDKLAQKRQVKECHIPEVYRGYSTNFAGNLALCVLNKPFQITNVVQPVCVDWNNELESQQLKSGIIGSVVGWGLVDPNKGQANEELKQLNVPYITLAQCLNAVPENFRRWVTSDKICAGFTNGSSVCNGDSGGGLVFKWTENNREKYYIRGLVAVGPIKDGVCDSFQYGVYTRISYYMDFMQNIIAANPVKD